MRKPQKDKRQSISTTTGLFLLLALLFAWITSACQNRQGTAAFSGDRALKDVAYQVGLGPRIPESQAHARVIQWIQAQLDEAGWETEQQVTEKMGHRLVNIVGKRGSSGAADRPWIILGAHYDSRLLADQDSNAVKRNRPVPGANDGASGVAVLLELARTLPPDLPVELWLAFFDGEDNGSIEGWDWILGSRAFAESLQSDGAQLPEAVVIVDMIGDKDLNIYLEQNSHPEASAQIWQAAERLGYSSEFIPQAKYGLLDDHIPFVELGIPAVDIIDIEYPYWHTSEDTLDKVSARSLRIVGETLMAWLKNGAPIGESDK